MKKIIFVLVISLLFVGCGALEYAKEAIESGYFEGQRDALNNDFRIKKLPNGCYKWIKSPWDDQSAPVYNIEFKCDKKK